MVEPKSAGGAELTLRGDAREVTSLPSLEPAPLEEKGLTCQPRAGAFVEVFKESSDLDLSAPLAIDLSEAGHLFPS